LVADALAAERFNVMGRSGGGPYALGCAALLGSRVASVATLAGIAPFHLLEGGSKATTDDNASMYAATETAEGLRELERTYERLAKGIRADSNHLLQHLDPDLRRADKEILSAANLMALTRFGHHDGMRQGAAGWLADSNAAAHDWGFELDFSTPAFIWSGQDDGFTPPEHGEALHQRLANSALLQTDGAAHFTALATMPYLLAMQRNFYQADVNDRPGKNSADQLTLFMRSEQTTHIAQSIGHTAIWHTADHPNDVIYRL
jgi:pimeloyl-ACP methyl ester carboxylesterase